MTTGWRTVKLGELLSRTGAPVDADPSLEYSEITVRLWGKGVVERGRVSGAQVNGRRFVARTGNFIASRIDARNGAMGLVPESLDGALVTNDFPLFQANKEQLDLDYLGWLSKTAGFVELCLRASEGTTNRVRLKEERFLALEIPLPPLAEQRRIVARIEGLAAQIEEARRLRKEAVEEAEALKDRASYNLFPESDGTSVSDFVKFQTGYAFKSDWFSDVGVRLARNANIGHGTIDWGQAVRLPEERLSEFSQFELHEGDILITLDRPLISTGVKVAKVREVDLPCLLLQRVARAKFLGEAILPDYFFLWLQSPRFTEEIDPGRSNGVPHISHKQIEAIPFAAPPRREQHCIVAELNDLKMQVNTLKMLQSETAAELDALLPAILDRAFKGEI